MKILAWPGPATPTSNPYCQLLYDGLQRVQPGIEVSDFAAWTFWRGRRSWDVWHMHWPEELTADGSALRTGARLVVFATFVAAARMTGTRLVWTAHNVVPHDSIHPRFDAGLRKWLAARLDGVIALTEHGASRVLETYPGLTRTPLAVIPHGHYMDVYPNAVGREEARSRLGLGATDRVLVFFGRIRPYKNVSRLIHAFRRLEGRDLRLVVAGDPESSELGRRLRRAAEGDSRVHLHLDLVPTEDVQLFLNAADVVVLPFRRILNSGSAVLALSFGRPILVPDEPTMRELRDVVGTRFVFTYADDLESEDLRGVLTRARPDAAARRSLEATLRDRMGWERIARETLEFFRRVAGGPEAPTAWTDA